MLMSPEVFYQRNQLFFHKFDFSTDNFEGFFQEKYDKLAKNEINLRKNLKEKHCFLYDFAPKNSRFPLYF